MASKVAKNGRLRCYVWRGRTPLPARFIGAVQANSRGSWLRLCKNLPIVALVILIRLGSYLIRCPRFGMLLSLHEMHILMVRLDAAGNTTIP